MSSTPTPSTRFPKNSTTVRSQRAVPGPPLALRFAHAGLAALSKVSPGAAGSLASQVLRTPRRPALRAWERELLAGARRLPARIGHHRIAAWQFGDPAAPQVLCIHGWEGRGAQYAAYVEPLLADGFGVTLVDAPGHGRSDYRRSSVFLFADALWAANRVVSDVVAIVGHSMGAAATVLALSEGLEAKRAVLLAPPRELRSHLLRFSETAGLSAAASHKMLEALAALGQRPIESLCVADMAASLRQPLLVVHDQGDPLMTIDEGRDVAAAASATIIETQGLGHNGILRDPAAVESVRAFLRPVLGSGAPVVS